MKKSIILFLALCLIITAVACDGTKTPDGKDTQPKNGGSVSEGVIKIALVAPMTGDNAEYGIGFKNAVELMIEQWNEKGGVLGKKIVLLAFDDKNSPEEGGTIAQKVISDKDVVGVIGHFSSSVTMTASPVYQRNNLVLISPSSSHPDFTKEGDCCFRLDHLTEIEMAESVAIGVDHFAAKNFGLLSIKTDWGASTAEAVRKIIEEKYADKGIRIVCDEDVVEGSDDYSPFITKMVEANVDTVVLVGMYSTLAPFCKQYRQENPDINVVASTNAYTDQLLELGGESVERVAFPVAFFHLDPRSEVQQFVKEYKEKTNGSIPSSLTAQAYDSAGILLTAIQNCGSLDKEKIKEAVKNIEYQGVIGPIKFDENRDVLKKFTHVIVENGEYVMIDD